MLAAPRGMQNLTERDGNARHGVKPNFSARFCRPLKGLLVQILTTTSPNDDAPSGQWAGASALADGPGDQGVDNNDQEKQGDHHPDAA